jgi:hypothetical protein
MQRGSCAGNSTLCVQNGATRIFHKMPPGFGQFHDLMIPLEKAQVDLRFKLDNSLAQRRLLDTQPLSCARKVQFLRKHNCRLQEANLR